MVAVGERERKGGGSETRPGPPLGLKLATRRAGTGTRLGASTSLSASLASDKTALAFVHVKIKMFMKARIE